ncbi:hypothetical protein GCM10007989_17290 [Devosia pacifica]|uniref:LPS export ABC transporter periplasmic protein LptC n=1 Tax=Devosia pacifica TaxID=1335967 RepID=A0A918S3T6_9HYPH|nr:hypothetical protein [Devosia pacifica]GHA22439.1 hypothetical protein GCM10007989_17290 [Devosia pacifica]
MALTDDTRARAAIFRRLQRRNRAVDVFRIALPVCGIVIFVFLAIQISISNAGSGFILEHVTEVPDTVRVETPEYRGVLEDGGHYSVWAGEAFMQLDDTDRIALAEAGMELIRPASPTMSVSAPEATLDTSTEVVDIEGIARVSDATGTTGILEQSRFAWSQRHLVSEGPVNIDYADGTKLEAGALDYDLGAGVWTFRDVRVTLPDTPGASPRDDAGARP